MKPATFDAMRNYEEWFVTALAVEGGVCKGVIALDILTGQLHAIQAKAVIMATGGNGRIYNGRTTNAWTNTGDGMADAYRAGAPLMAVLPSFCPL